MTGMTARGCLTITIPVEVVSASRGKLTVRLDGVTQVVYAGGTLMVTGDVTVEPR